MEAFVQTRSDSNKKVYDHPMPRNSDSYGGSSVKDPDGNVHKQITHSKVWVWDADDPGKPLSVTIISGNGGKAEGQSTIAGAIEYVVPLSGLCSVEADAGRNLCVFADIFPIWEE